MGAGFGVFVAAFAGSIGYLIAHFKRRARLEAWRAASRGAGLEAIEESEGTLFEGPRLTARSGSLRLRLEGYRRGNHDSGSRIVVSGLGHGSGGLSLRREGLATAFEKSFVGEREIEVGARAFDDEFFVQGHPALALAVLDREARTRLGRLLRGQLYGERSESGVRASLADGVIVVDVRERLFDVPGDNLTAALAAALDVARRLVAPPDLAARIAENVRTEPEAGARLQGLLALAREFPDHPESRRALLAALADPSAEVRLRAAMALGEEGRDALLDLVSSGPETLAARAVAALGPRLPPELAEATLRRALGEPGRPETAAACAEVLGRMGRAEAEGLLVDALASGDPRVRKAAAQALGRAGTVAAIPALAEAMPPRGDLPRSVGRQAIAEIQARLSGAAPGQLSLAGGEAGALSLAGGEPGRLSMAEDAGKGEADEKAEEKAEEKAPPPRPTNGVRS